MRNDYQIGDWLYDVSGVPKQVQEVYDDSVTLGGVLCHLSTVKPIPLTKKILEKNGFEGMPYAFFKLDNNSWLEYYYHEYRLTKWWSGIDEWNNSSHVKETTFQCQCHYVHQLQHGLNLCEIDKEIIV